MCFNNSVTQSSQVQPPADVSSANSLYKTHLEDNKGQLQCHKRTDLKIQQTQYSLAFSTVYVLYQH